MILPTTAQLLKEYQTLFGSTSGNADVDRQAKPFDNRAGKSWNQPR